MNWQQLLAPVSAGIGQGLAGALSGAVSAPPIGPDVISATQGAYGGNLDGSGWAINFSGMQVASSSPTNTSAEPGPFGGQVPAAQAGASMPLVWAAVIVGGALLWRATRKRK